MGSMALLGIIAGGVLNATLSPPSLTTASILDPFTTRSVTGLVTDGSGTYTYAWSVIDNGGVTVVANSPTSATTTFTLSSLPVATINITVRLTVTDSVTAATATVDLAITHINFTYP